MGIIKTRNKIAENGLFFAVLFLVLFVVFGNFVYICKNK